MKRRQLVWLLVITLMIGLTGFASESDARVSVAVNIDLPPYTFETPPPLVVIPGTYAYYAPEADVEIVFYNGYWYRPHKLRWFRSRNYNGPWSFVAPGRIPQGLVELPSDYRMRFRDHPKIDYRDFRRNWRNWEKTRHWEKDERWREGGRRERHEEKMEHKREDRREQQEHRGR